MSRVRAVEILKWVKGPKVLDIGCTSHTLAVGSPHWLHGQIRQRFPDAAGIDISQDNVAVLQKAGFTNLYVQSAESFDLPEKFDTIVAGELIEHLANPGLFLQRVRHHLTPQGTIVLTTPNPFSISYVLYAALKFPRTCYNLEHTCWFCPQTMADLAQRSGFEIRHFELIDDYDSDVSSFLYRLFGAIVKLCRPALPKRFRNTMLFVLAADGSSDGADR
jgi:SAM-dependent methyltransferase